jgi:superfamily II DNA or RNA helicase
MSFSPGSLVSARGREWVVLPESTDRLVIVRPLSGTEDEVTGIHTGLEAVTAATFDPPDPARIGDFRSCRLLRDALRLGFRSSAGPFRSFAKIAVEPRPYQLVPLLMALRLDPVRLLIADDVGIGKTVEACLVMRELLDRGEVRRATVLCPPHLAEQWQRELKEKFYVDAELVLSSTASRLERSCLAGQSIFEAHPFTVVSTDFIKSDSRRDEFIRTCPELVIVDEAHTCAFAAGGRGGRHQRYQLVKALSTVPGRHLILVTATPHSGNEEAFRSLLLFLDREFANLPQELGGRENEQHRRRLAQHLVQRRRGDIRHYMQADTPFPEREEREDTYKLSPDYKKLFAKVLNYARESVVDARDGGHRQRVRWWSALALLRALASSPAAAAATLRSRAATADAASAEEADEIGQRTVLDLVNDEAAEGIDVTLGADAGEDDGSSRSQRRRLLDMAREADALRGEADEKLQKSVKLVKELLRDGFQPIVFCRFIDTAAYVAETLRGQLGRNVEVEAVTGLLPPAEREARVQRLAGFERHVLVCTDCLSEGINLQDHFSAVLHYDLSWNPTRHEQREGRVDRYGQPAAKVRVLTYYGIDNQIDGVVLDVLIRKHKSIRTSLGISVPLPLDAEKVVEAIFEGLLLRGRSGQDVQQMPLFDEDVLEPIKKRVHRDWESVADREKRSQTMFAQQTIKVEEVARELAEVRAAIGSGVDVAGFTRDAMKLHGAVVSDAPGEAMRIELSELPTALRESLDVSPSAASILARCELPVSEGVVYLTRTHPVVEKLAAYILDSALDPLGQAKATRCGVIRSDAVRRRTTLLLLRLRYQISSPGTADDTPLLAEDAQVVAFAGSADAPEWLLPEEAERLLTVEPTANTGPGQAADAVEKVIVSLDQLREHLNEFARARGRQILASHQRVREAARMKGTARIEAKLPADVLGVFVYLPVPKL